MKKFKFLLIATLASLFISGCATAIDTTQIPRAINQPSAIEVQQPTSNTTAPIFNQGAVTQPTYAPSTSTSTAPINTVPIAPTTTYKNVDGNTVTSPYYAPTAPAGASARCNDGTYSFSQHRSGTCSHHGGVAEWL